MPVRSSSRARSLRALPAVEAVLQQPALAPALAAHPRSFVVEAVRAELAEARARLAGGRDGAAPAPDALAAQAAARVAAGARPALRRVLNATGVVLHTNLGRAPLAAPARDALLEAARGYCSLELDLETGRRGDRGLGVERWITRLTGAEAAIAVNNGAAAILLALSALAAGRKVIVSRGELVEIGGSFRVPDIMAKSGAELVEVGTTNRTHLRDYERALDRHRDAGAVLRVHPSNFRIGGFTTRPEAAELARVAHRHKVPLIEDLGSGALVALGPLGLEHEPTAAESLRAGCDVVTFSGDKLLGGAQAGLAVGRRRWIDKLRRDPLARVTRLDKLALAVLEATLPLYADPQRAQVAIPALAMLRLGPQELGPRADRIASALLASVPGLSARVVDGDGEVGGGALPLERLRGRVVELRHADLTTPELERHARTADPAVIGTVRGGAFRVDPRTLLEGEDDVLVATLARAWGSGAAVAPGR
jgi:L-seryl-tRNA(Ser) seleniumtransferase